MKTVIAAIFLAIIAAYATVQLTSSSSINQPRASLHETQKIRCGYNYWAPFLTYNEETRELKGFMFNLINEVARIGKVNVEWSGIIDWDNVPADLNAGKHDANCGPLFATAVRAKGVLFSAPYGYQKIEPFTRVDDQRFGGNLSDINRPDIRVVGWEGTTTLDDAKRRIPNATFITLPSMASVSDAYVYVADNKADVFFDSFGNAQDFMKNNPNRIKRANPNMIIAQQALAIAVAQDNPALARFFDVAIDELKSTGVFQKLVAQYEQESPGFLYIEPVEISQ